MFSLQAIAFKVDYQNVFYDSSRICSQLTDSHSQLDGEI